MMTYSKDLYDYLLKVFDLEKGRIKNIEEKAKYIFSINSLILIGVFFKYKDIIDSLKKLEPLVKNTGISCLVISLLCLMISFFLTATVVKVRKLKGIYPDNLVNTLFNPDSNFVESDTKEDFYLAMSKHIALSIEFNRSIIAMKNKRVRFSLLYVILGLVGVALFLSTIIIYG